MCNLYSMTSTVDELRRIFGPFEGDKTNLPPYDEIFPGYSAPVLRRRDDGALNLDMMKWGFPGPTAAGGRPVTNVRNLNSAFWRNALTDPKRRCIVPVTELLRMDRRGRPQVEGLVRPDGRAAPVICIRRDLAAGRAGPVHGVPDV